MAHADEGSDELLRHSDELLQRSDEAAERARGYLEEREPDVTPLGQLPEADQRLVHDEPPALRREDEPHCAATGRMRDEPVTGGSYMDQRYPVPCLRPPSHDGPHVAKSRWEAPGTWSVWAWD